MTPHALMRADLKRSGLNGEDEKILRLEALDASEVRRLTRHLVPAYRLPYFDFAGEPIDFYRLRFTGEVIRDGDLIRYWQPPKSRPYVYLPPYCDWLNGKRDTSQPVVFTEGEKKAAAGAKILERLVLALGGSWNFQAKKLHIDLLSELREINFEGRETFIAFDGDAATNEHVALAERHLAARLGPLGADVRFIRLPPDLKLDDFLLRYGPDDFYKLRCDPADLRTTIRVIRSKPKLPAHEKDERVSNTVLADMASRGSFHTVDHEPLWFDRAERRLHSLLTPDDGNLRAFVVEAYGLNPSESVYRHAFERVRAHAVRHGDAAITPLFAYYDRAHAALFLDVGANRVAKVTAIGWTLEPNGVDDVLFRGCRMEPVEPARRGAESALDDLLALPNFAGGDCLTKTQQRLVYELNFWSLFFPTLLPTRPLLLLDAVKGSGKSTGARAAGVSLFGSGFDVHSVDAKRLDDVTTALVNNPLVVLDNLDGRLPGIENLLAVASTGGTVPRRVLYTTMTLAEYRLRARVIATSRQPDVFVRDDLRDRTIILSLDRLASFRAESDILGETLARRPALWAYVLGLLPDVVKALATAKPEPVKHRLADFARFALAVGPALGHRRADVEAALDAVEAERTSFAGHHSLLLQALDYWIEFQRLHRADVIGCVDRTAGDILTMVNIAWPHGAPPFQRPEKFALALKNEDATLRATYDIRRKPGRANQTLITIRLRKDDTDGR